MYNIFSPGCLTAHNAQTRDSNYVILCAQVSARTCNIVQPLLHLNLEIKCNNE